jgi:hypothetical protein
MPKLSSSVPKYRKHRASGQAVVTIAGKDHYLGPHGTKASKLEYDRLIAEWLAEGRPSAPTPTVREISVNELVLEFWKFAQRRYRKDGRPTGTADSFRPALSRHGDLDANWAAESVVSPRATYGTACRASKCSLFPKSPPLNRSGADVRRLQASRTGKSLLNRIRSRQSQDR